MGFRLIYRGREITDKHIDFIRKVIAKNPDAGRRFLSQHICRAWNWVQPNGVLKDGVCRGLLLRLEAEGYIKLPPRKSLPPNPSVNRQRPPEVEIDQSPIQCELSEIRPIHLLQVRRTPLEGLFNYLIEQYHYLGYTKPVGENLKILAFTHHRPIACFAWSSPAWHIGPRDRFIGWSVEERKRNLHLIAYLQRFLVLPWIRVPYLASHLLSLSTKTISTYWQALYNHPLFWVESFVDTERFKGSSFRAANWIYLGETTGRGKLDHTYKKNRSLKAVWGYPLSKHFREELCRGRKIA